MLELRPNCERCDRSLPPESDEARICSYECTFCADCVASHLQNVCPNCGGGFQARPVRPRTEWRNGLSLAHQPASAARKSMKYSDGELEPFIERLKGLPPSGR